MKIRNLSQQRASRTKNAPIVLGVGAFFIALLMQGLSACRPLSDSDQTPHLLAVIEMPSDMGIMTCHVVVHPNGLAYVVNGGGTVAVLDGPQLVKLIPWPGEVVAPTFQEIAVQPVTGWVYVTDYDRDAIHVFSGTEVLATIQNVGYRPNAIAIHPDAGYIYVANARGDPKQFKPGSVAIISGTQVITRLQVGFVPQIIVANPVDGRVYVGQAVGNLPQSPGTLAIIEGTRLITMTSLGWEAPRTVKDMAIDERTGAVYMIQEHYLTYWNDKQIERIELGAHGKRVLNNVAVDSKHGLAYVGVWAAPPNNALIVVHEGQVVTEIPVSDDPRQIAVDETHDYVYVVNRMEGSMSIIRDTQVITTLSTGGIGPTFLAVDEKRGYIYVSNSDTHSVAVFGFGN